jgi:serine/threonine-protein kinase
MNEPRSIPGSSVSSVPRSSELAANPRPQRGPETVINPERRVTASVAPEDSPAQTPASSSIVRLLFPPNDDVENAAFDAPRGIGLGHFSIVERIRSGGMGAVFRAIDQGLNRVVALKVLPPALSRDPLIVQRFKNEAQAAAQLDHENIARVFYSGEEQGLHFIAFEYVTGVNVRELIQQQGRLPIADAVNYALQIATALAHTSAQGVVHRDIKPSNIIITPGGRAKLVDLGLARKENRDEEAADLTMAGTTLGTFDYISPEQARDPRTADIRSDIYSLGCTLYHMLTGVPPYPEGTVLQKLLQHQGDEAPDPAQKNRAVPENLSIVVRKMMAKDPRRRYQNAEQLIRDMMLVAGAMGLRSVSPEGLVWLSANPEHSSFWERHLAWMATAAALLVIVGYLEYGGSARAPRSADGASAERAFTRGQAPDLPRFRPGTAAQADDSSPRRTATVPQTATGLRVGVRQVAADLKGSGNSVADPSDAAPEENSPNPLDDGDPAPAPFRPVPLDNIDGSRNDGRFTVGPRQDSSKRPLAVDPLDPEPPDRERIVDKNPDANAPGANSPDTNPRGRDKGTAANSPGGSGNGRAAPPRRDRDSEESPIPSEDEGYFLLGRDGTADRRFATLEAACSEIRRDGAVIELRFDGRRSESSVKINRRVEIRAARGRHPVIEFRPRVVVTDGGQVRAISLPSGSLYLVGVEMTLVVDDTISADQWTMISVEHPDALRMERVTATVVNPRMTPASIVELRPTAGAMMPEMPMVGVQPRPPLEIEVADSLFRGQSDLFMVRHNEPARLAVRQCVVAVQGALLSSRGSTEAPQENSQLELKLEHVTAGLGGGLIKLDSGQVRKVLPVQVLAFDCIFSNAGSSPLISMTGNSPAQDFRPLLIWSGTNNVYDRIHTFWSIVSMQDMGRTETWDFAAWSEKWTDSKEANAREVGAGHSLWSGRKPWSNKPMTDLTASDFALDRRPAQNNPAVAGGTNSTDAGADLERIPRPGTVLATDPAAAQRE